MSCQTVGLVIGLFGFCVFVFLPVWVFFKKLQFYSIKLHKFLGVVLQSSFCHRKYRTVLKIEVD